MLKDHPDVGRKPVKPVEISAFMERMDDAFGYDMPKECYNAAEIIDVVEGFYNHYESDIELYLDSKKTVVAQLPDNIYELNYCDIDKLDGTDLDMFYGKMACVLLREHMLYLDILQYVLEMKFDLKGGNYKYLLDEVKELREKIIRFALLEGVNYYNANSNASMVVRMKPTVRVGMIYALLKSISKENIEDIMQVKKRFTSAWLCAENDVEEIDFVVGQITDSIREKAEKADDFRDVQNRVLNEIESYGSLISLENIKIPDSFITSLATGEYLFDRYIIKEKEDKEFDYSFISIMYYTALENLVNGVLYTPYISSTKDALKQIPGRQIGDYFSDRNDPREKNRDGKYKRNRFLRYDRSNGVLYPIEAVEIGTIGRLIGETSKIKELKLFLKKIGMTNNQIDKLQIFGGRLCDAANYRNKAAHGSATLSMGEATRDKNRTYVIKTAEEYKAYIIELLEILSEK